MNTFANLREKKICSKEEQKKRFSKHYNNLVGLAGYQSPDFDKKIREKQKTLKTVGKKWTESEEEYMRIEDRLKNTLKYYTSKRKGKNNTLLEEIYYDYSYKNPKERVSMLVHVIFKIFNNTCIQLYEKIKTMTSTDLELYKIHSYVYRDFNSIDISYYKGNNDILFRKSNLITMQFYFHKMLTTTHLKILPNIKNKLTDLRKLTYNDRLYEIKEIIKNKNEQDEIKGNNKRRFFGSQEGLYKNKYNEGPVKIVDFAIKQIDKDITNIINYNIKKIINNFDALHIGKDSFQIKNFCDDIINYRKQISKTRKSIKWSMPDKNNFDQILINNKIYSLLKIHLNNLKKKIFELKIILSESENIKVKNLHNLESNLSNWNTEMELILNNKNINQKELHYLKKYYYYQKINNRIFEDFDNNISYEQNLSNYLYKQITKNIMNIHSVIDPKKFELGYKIYNMYAKITPQMLETKKIQLLECKEHLIKKVYRPIIIRFFERVYSSTNCDKYSFKEKYAKAKIDFESCIDMKNNSLTCNERENIKKIKQTYLIFFYIEKCKKMYDTRMDIEFLNKRSRTCSSISGSLFSSNGSRKSFKFTNSSKKKIIIGSSGDFEEVSSENINDPYEIESFKYYKCTNTPDCGVDRVGKPFHPNQIVFSKHKNGQKHKYTCGMHVQKKTREEILEIIISKGKITDKNKINSIINQHTNIDEDKVYFDRKDFINAIKEIDSNYSIYDSALGVTITKNAGKLFRERIKKLDYIREKKKN